MNLAIQIIQELIAYDDSIEPHKPAPVVLKDFAALTDEDTVLIFVMSLLIWLYHNGSYQKIERLDKRKESFEVIPNSEVRALSERGIKSIPGLSDLFSVSGDTISFADRVSFADRLALEEYVFKHYRFYVPHVHSKQFPIARKQ